MTVFLLYFFKHQAHVTQSGFNNVSYVFAARLNGMRAQWMMDGQPRFILVDNKLTRVKTKVIINRKGWVDNSATSSGCKVTWQRVMGTSLEANELPVKAIWSTSAQWPFCRYSLSSGEFFTYSPHNGQVTDVELVQ
jgi:hypothetical protein